ncbi:MAG: hypothetical protein IJF76_03235 [Clostridia bacterium]|nr:hypothetical protein [Clostridia bacterium]
MITNLLSSINATEGIIGIVVPILVGALCIVIGILNRKGNISMLHSYHRSRVSEEDRLPFGKRVGLGMIVIGVTVIVNGIFIGLSEFLVNETLSYIGIVIMAIGMIIGITIAFHAMKKYNKDIF